MEAVYAQDFTLTDNCVDCHGRLKLSTLLYYGQEVAGRHFDRISMTYDQLAEKGMFWAIIRQRVRIHRLPCSGETIRVETWPMPNSRVAFPRNVVAYDSRGNEIFRILSLWVLMDVQTRAMILPGKSGLMLPGTLRGDELPSPASLPARELCNQEREQLTYGKQLDFKEYSDKGRYRFYVQGVLPEQSDMQCHVICQVDGENVMKMVIRIPESKNDAEQRVKNYYVKKLHYLCGFGILDQAPVLK